MSCLPPPPSWLVSVRFVDWRVMVCLLGLAALHGAAIHLRLRLSDGPPSRHEGRKWLVAGWTCHIAGSVAMAASTTWSASMASWLVSHYSQLQALGCSVGVDRLVNIADQRSLVTDNVGSVGVMFWVLAVTFLRKYSAALGPQRPMRLRRATRLAQPIDA